MTIDDDPPPEDEGLEGEDAGDRDPPAAGDASPAAEEQAAAEQAGEHPVPPSTWAGRKRAHEDDDGDDDDDGEDAGLTAEFAEIERELDEELEGLSTKQHAAAGSDEAEQPEAAGDESDRADQPDESDDAEKPRDPAEEDERREDAEAAGDGAAEAEAEDPSATAHAALRARATGGWKTAPGAEKEAVAAAVEKPEATPEKAKREKPPHARPIWARFLAASLIIIASMASAFAVSALVFVADLARGLGGIEGVADRLDDVDGGDPQTILILGSDIRPTDDTGRSDTTLLLRVDPDNNAMNLLSIPRDLKVTIPNHGIDKFNAAYSYGGPELTLRVVKQLTGLKINHVVNINFVGFADAVNAIGCVFIDVDRRYYVPEGSEYSAIDPPIEAGYQKLCGFKALQYVRYRLEDNDLVRAARQQDFVREARQKIEPGKLLYDANYRFELLDVFKEYTTSDDNLRSTDEVLDLMKTFLGAHDATLSQVKFPAELGETYVTAGDDKIKLAVEEFLNEDEPAPEPEEEPAGDNADGGNKSGSGKPDKPDDKPEQPEEPDGPPMDDASGQTEPIAAQLAETETKGGRPMLKFPVYYPTALVPGSIVTDNSRAFKIDGPKEYRGYKIVATVQGAEGSGLMAEYYGVSGTNWVDPPILENPSEEREIDGREYLFFYDADRLRMIGWKEKKGSYWVQNTLLHTLSEEQMLAIAKSMRELDG